MFESQIKKVEKSAPFYNETETDSWRLFGRDEEIA